MSQEIGIDTLKEITAWGISLAAQLDHALEDKKFRWHEAFGFVDELKELPELISKMDEAGAEFRDLDIVEKNQLVEFVADELELSNEWAEKITQNALDTAAAVYLNIKTFKELKSSRK